MKGRNHVAHVHSARVAGHEPRPRLRGGQRRQARLLGGHQQVQDAGAGAGGPGSGSCATGIAYLLDCVKPMYTYRHGIIYCIPLKYVCPALLY